MVKITIWTGIILFVLGLVSFILTGSQSFTALIPSAFGVLLFICALIAGNENRQKIAMHIAQVLALLGLLGSISGLVKLLIYVFGTGMLERPAAIIAQTIMAIICLIYLILGIRTFINARKTQS
jgi:hypothetical protein